MTVTDEKPTVRDLPEPEFLELVALIGEVEPGEKIRWDAGRELWLSGSLEVCREIGANPDLFPNVARDADLAPAWLDHEFYVWFEGGPKRFNFLRGAEHRRLHRWWMHQFSPKQIDDWRQAVVRPLLNDLIDAFVERGHADLMGELALGLTLPVILRMLEFPTDGELGRRYHEVAHAFNDLRWSMMSGPTSDELRERATQVSTEARELLMPYVTARQSGEGQDLVSRLWRDAPDLYDGEITAETVYAGVMSLFQAGVGTSAGAITDALYVLAKRPEWQDRLREDVELIPNFVEEALRLTCPGLYMYKVVAQDTEFHGAQLKRGDRIAGFSLVANRDPAYYDHPSEIDITRKAPRAHMAFSSGERSCAGQAVGRLEVQESVRAVTQRLHDLRLDTARPAPQRAGAGARRPWDSLNVVFTPAAPMRSQS